MNRFLQMFKTPSKCKVIGMIHVAALPGTPKYNGNWQHVIEQAKHEAQVYAKHRLDAVLIENMHDVPYVQDPSLGPEIIACMTRLASEVRQLLPATMPCGLQILASGNKQALAVCKASGLQFIRAEGFVFGHVADEGYTNACAGELLRYRRQIDAEHVLILTDLKKKHSAHAITQDVSLLETAKAAEFFLTDGIILTGMATGHAADPMELNDLIAGKIQTPLLIGSGITCDNIDNYFAQCDGVIIGSHFKQNGNWQNELCEETINDFMHKISQL